MTNMLQQKEKRMSLQVTFLEPEQTDVMISELEPGDFFTYEPPYGESKYGDEGAQVYMVQDVETDFRAVVGRTKGEFATDTRVYAIRLWNGYRLAQFRPETVVEPLGEAQLLVARL